MMRGLRILSEIMQGARGLFIWDRKAIGASLENLGLLSKKELGEMKMMLNGGGETKMKTDEEGRELKHLKLVFPSLRGDDAKSWIQDCE